MEDMYDKFFAPRLFGCKQCQDTGVVYVGGSSVICACQLPVLRKNIENARPDVPPGTGMVYGGEGSRLSGVLEMNA